MRLDELVKQFIVDEDALQAHLEPLLAEALKHCRVDKNGRVLITNANLSSKNQVKLTLAARALAAQLDDQFLANVSVGEISKYTGLPAAQVRARGKDSIEDKFAESPKPGVYRAIPIKIETFLNSLSGSNDGEKLK
jgi:hypothetical protein